MPDETNEGGSQPTPEPKSTTAEIGNMVNAAVTAHIRRFTEKQLPELLKGHLETALRPIAEKLAAPPPVQEEPDGKKQKPPPPEVLALQQKLDATLAQLKEADDKRASAERKAREDRAFSDLKSSLAGSVRPEMLDMLANHLFKIEQRVEIQDDGTMLFKSQRNSYGVVEDVLLPLKDGVEAYLKTDVAKPFIPAPAASQAPQTKKQPYRSSQSVPETTDYSKMTSAQKTAAAEKMEADILAKLAAANRRLP